MANKGTDYNKAKTRAILHKLKLQLLINAKGLSFAQYQSLSAELAKTK